MTKDYPQSLSLLCPTCAGDQFEFDDAQDEETRTYLCLSCAGSFSHAAIMAANSGRIEEKYEEIGREFIEEAEEKFSKLFKKLN